MLQKVSIARGPLAENEGPRIFLWSRVITHPLQDPIRVERA